MLIIEVKNLNKQKTSPASVVGPAVQRMTSDALLAGQRELVIEHGTEEYRLRLTSKGKLILTK